MRGATLPAVEVPARMHRRQSMKQNMSIPVNAIVKALEIPCSDQHCNTPRAAAIKQLRRIEAYRAFQK